MKRAKQAPVRIVFANRYSHLQRGPLWVAYARETFNLFMRLRTQ